MVSPSLPLRLENFADAMVQLSMLPSGSILNFKSSAWVPIVGESPLLRASEQDTDGCIRGQPDCGDIDRSSLSRSVRPLTNTRLVSSVLVTRDPSDGIDHKRAH